MSLSIKVSSSIKNKNKKNGYYKKKRSINKRFIKKKRNDNKGGKKIKRRKKSGGTIKQEDLKGFTDEELKDKRKEYRNSLKKLQETNMDPGGTSQKNLIILIRGIVNEQKIRDQEGINRELKRMDSKVYDEIQKKQEEKDDFESSVFESLTPQQKQGVQKKGVLPPLETEIATSKDTLNAAAAAQRRGEMNV